MVNHLPVSAYTWAWVNMGMALSAFARGLFSCMLRLLELKRMEKKAAEEVKDEEARAEGGGYISLEAE